MFVPSSSSPAPESSFFAPLASSLVPDFSVFAPSRSVPLFAANCPAPFVNCVLRVFKPESSCVVPLWSVLIPLFSTGPFFARVAAPVVSASLFFVSSAKPEMICWMPAEAVAKPSVLLSRVATFVDRVPMAAERPDMLVFSFFTFFSNSSSGLPSGICFDNSLSSVRPLLISETFAETVPNVLLSDVIAV